MHDTGYLALGVAILSAVMAVYVIINLV
jgi:hypothetical protein